MPPGGRGDLRDAGRGLPRLSPAAYNMVVCAGSPKEYSEHLAGLLDLVRVGGMLVCHGLLEGTRFAERTVGDQQTVAWRQISHTIRDDETLLSAVLPIGNGLLVAKKRETRDKAVLKPQLS